MIRKTTAAVVLAGALALGTASATSLGTFDDVSFAASDVDLLNCEIPGTLTFLPEVPDPTTLTATELAEFLALDTFALGSVDLSGLPLACQDEVLDVVFIGSGAVLDTITDVDLTTVTDLTAVDLGSMLDTSTVLDVAAIDEIRLVVSNQ